jgi:hypothetical protein
MLKVTCGSAIHVDCDKLGHAEDRSSPDSVHTCKDGVSAVVRKDCGGWTVATSGHLRWIHYPRVLVRGREPHRVNLSPAKRSFSVYSRDCPRPRALEPDSTAHIEVSAVEKDARFSRTLRERRVCP